MMYDGQWQVYCGCFLFLFGTTRVTTITQMIRTFLSPLISAPVPNPNVNPKVNVKSVIPHEECRLGAHLPSLGRELGGGQTTEVCYAWPVRRQTYGYLPSRRASPPNDRYPTDREKLGLHTRHAQICKIRCLHVYNCTLFKVFTHIKFVLRQHQSTEFYLSCVRSAG